VRIAIDELGKDDGRAQHVVRHDQIVGQAADGKALGHRSVGRCRQPVGGNAADCLHLDLVAVPAIERVEQPGRGHMPVCRWNRASN
jgi:hypothetical protein